MNDRQGEHVRTATKWSRLGIQREFDHLTHYLFRYPAKFHPPVASALLERFTKPGNVVLDPFCGSGTLLVEAMVRGRPCFGVDVDPIAVAVSRAKTHRYCATELERSADRVLDRLSHYERSVREYEDRMFVDLSSANFEKQLQTVNRWVPHIPNIHHWFRRYVIVDLARILSVIERVRIPTTHRDLLRVVFASIIRNASNADPVPVSGLEVTKHMRQRDRDGRYVNPFQLFEDALGRALSASAEFSALTQPGAATRVAMTDATLLSRRVTTVFDAVITSPPYHSAVEYYRRHQLEMFWLGATKSVDDRLVLLQRYLGRAKVAQSHPFVAQGILRTALAKSWEARIRRVSEERANSFLHYIVGMSRFFESLAPRVRARAPVVLVVGHSGWNNSQIPTAKLFAEISQKHFSLDEMLWYPVKNRYMSYTRHNGADINREYVIVLRRRGRPARKANLRRT